MELSQSEVVIQSLLQQLGWYLPSETVKVWLLDKWLLPSTIIVIAAAISNLALLFITATLILCTNFIIITFIPFKLEKSSSSCSSKKKYGSVKTMYIRNKFHSPSLSIRSSLQRYSVMNSDKAWLSLLLNRARPSRTKLFEARATSLSFDIAKRKSRTARTNKKERSSGCLVHRCR